VERVFFTGFAGCEKTRDRWHASLPDEFFSPFAPVFPFGLCFRFAGVEVKATLHNVSVST
jgi:hypothetical protein